MKLPVEKLFLWLCIIAVKILLSFIAWRRDVHKHAPVFAAYLFSVSLLHLFLLTVYLTDDLTMNYFYGFTVVSLIGSLLTALCLVEVYLRTYGPRAAVPDEAYAKVMLWLASSLVLCAVVAAFAHSYMGSGPLTKVLETGQRIASVCTAAGWLVVALCAASEGYSWRYWPQRVTIGFSVSLVAGAAVRMAGGYVTSPSSAIALQIVGMASVLIVDLWWLYCCAFVHTPASELPPSLETLDECRSYLSEAAITIHEREEQQI